MQPVVDHPKGICRQGKCDRRQHPADNGRRAIGPTDPTEPYRLQSKDPLFRPESSPETHSSRPGGRMVGPHPFELADSTAIRAIPCAEFCVIG